jgi:hypothetical protein
MGTTPALGIGNRETDIERSENDEGKNWIPNFRFPISGDGRAAHQSEFPAP